MFSVLLAVRPDGGICDGANRVRRDWRISRSRDVVLPGPPTSPGSLKKPLDAWL